MERGLRGEQDAARTEGHEMSAPPVAFIWQGDCFKPASAAWNRLADRHYVVGARYELLEHEERSSASHRHFFAAVNEAWSNLPENLAAEYPNAETLRKHCLIKAGFADAQTHVCASKAEAARLAIFLRPIDEFSIVTTAGTTVTRYTARSQSLRAMGKEEFQRSKDGVLRVLAEMLGTSTDELQKAAAA